MGNVFTKEKSALQKWNKFPLGGGAIDMTPKRTFPKVIIAGVLVTAFCVIGLVLLLRTSLNRYQNSVAQESAEHLSEINRQIYLYVEESVQNDWQIVNDIAVGLENVNISSDEKLIEYLKRRKDVWYALNVSITTEDGIAVNQNNERLDGARIQERVDLAMERERYFQILDNTMEYTIPVNTENYFEGKKIIAVTLEVAVNSLVDNANLVSFDGEADIYLTRQNGDCISRFSQGDQEPVKNVMSLFPEGLTSIRGGVSLYDELSLPGTSEYYYEDGGEGKYLILTTIEGPNEWWNLFYVIKSDTVNSTMNHYMWNMIVLCTVTTVIVLIILLIALVYSYRGYMKHYTKELRNRETLFDLLVSETQNVFGMFSLDQEEPLYLTSNIRKVIGESIIYIKERNGEIKILDSSDREPAPLNLVNKALIGWDRKKTYISPYLPVKLQGEEHFIVLKLYPVSDSEGFFIGICQDVTQEQQRAEILSNALVMADKANHAKTEFLSKMSHDIRTPLNAILNMSRFLKEELDNREKAEEYLGVIQDSSEHLLELINEILDMSKIENGKLELNSEPFDLNECITQVYDMIRPTSVEKKQRFLVQRTEIIDRYLLGDNLRLRQILLNLLNNAVKFTDIGGEIFFEITQLPALREEVAAFRFIVRDNGIGIDEKSLEELFVPFSRAETARKKAIEGTGLGLAIAKSFIEAMGGSIQVTSHIGEGTTFTVEVFFLKDTKRKQSEGQTVVKNPISDEKELPFEGITVLLVEDSEINRQIAGIILSRWGMRIDNAENGKTAVDMVSRTPDRYRIIFMDVQMPVMDGYEACQNIRHMDSPAAGIPIIAMTANMMPEDVERARMAGMNAHVGKPIQPEELYTAICQVLQGIGR